MKKILRFILESLFLGVGIAYLYRTFHNGSRGAGEFRELVAEPLIYISGGLCFCVYLLMAWGIQRAIAENFPDRKAGFLKVYGAVSLSNLGKYIPGKIWSLVAFGRLGQRMGLPVAFMGGIFAANMLLGFLSAFLLFFMRTLPLGWGLALYLVMLAAGIFGWEPLSRIVQERIPFLRGRIPHGLGILWVVQWLNALMSGFAYYVIGEALGAGRELSFAALTTYPIGYMIAYMAFLVPGGVGVRESLLNLMDGSYAHSASALIVSRLMTVTIDLVGALLGLLIWVRKDSRNGEVRSSPL
ncbi:MAG: hypothetical protein HQL31_00230 [Planctomycetes bacterium]|nr:hypothetical protein [Planctomycetota bacterium]